MLHSSRSDSLTVLCDRLKSERLLVSYELATLKNLNTTVQNEFLELYKLSWTSRHERVNLL